MILPCNLSDPNIEIIMGSFVDTATQVYNGRTLSSYERRSRRSFARHDRMSFMLWMSKKSRFTCERDQEGGADHKESKNSKI